MEYKRMLSGGGTVKNGKRTQWSKAYDKDGKELDFSKHDKDWFDEYGEPACENKRMNMNKKSIRLTESDLHRIIKESVNRILREEWESPLDKAKKKRNDFDNVKKIDVSKFEKKSKKPKAGTFGDLPSFAKLKNLKNEAYDPSLDGGMEVNEENISSVIENICPFEITKYPDFLCVEVDGSYREFNACSRALAQAFGKDKVIGDGQLYSIYVSF